MPDDNIDLRTLQDTPPWDWPLGVGELFKEVLEDRHADPADRLIAAELAGDYTVINDDLAYILMSIVRNPAEPDDLRAAAAIAFGAALESSDTTGFDDPGDLPPISESAFRDIQGTLRAVYSDPSGSRILRRRVLEASVRAGEDWHAGAIMTAYTSGDRDWILTAVFAMRYVAGFNEQIVEALRSADPDIHYEAVVAAGNWEVAAAWPHISALLKDPNIPKELLLAAIETVPSIHPDEAWEVLEGFTLSEDEEIAEAAQEAIDMAEIGMDEEFEIEEDEEEEAD